jgi:hypothetical protein
MCETSVCWIPVLWQFCSYYFTVLNMKNGDSFWNGDITNERNVVLEEKVSATVNPLFRIRSISKNDDAFNGLCNSLLHSCPEAAGAYRSKLRMGVGIVDGQAFALGSGVEVLVR